MSDQNLDYEAIARNVEEGLERQKRLTHMIFFGMHLFFFLLTLAVVWGVMLANTQVRDVLFNNGLGPALVVIVPTALWAFMILGHIATLYMDSAAGQKELREKLLMSEVGEEILRKGLINAVMADKPKRRAVAVEAERMMLSDDGELVSADEDERREERGSSARSNHTGKAS